MVDRKICVWWMISWKFISPSFIIVSSSRSDIYTLNASEDCDVHNLIVVLIADT